jgi:hypothetical protein
MEIYVQNIFSQLHLAEIKNTFDPKTKITVAGKSWRRASINIRILSLNMDAKLFIADCKLEGDVRVIQCLTD